MNRILSYLISLAAAAAMALAMGACEDRLDYPGAPLPEGISTVDVSLGFKAFTPALEGRAAGNAIKNINTLWLVIYDKNGTFIVKKEITGFNRESLDENTRPDGTPSSESSTGHVTFKLTMPNGYYRIYAVANHNLGIVAEELIDTPDKLKTLDLTWTENPANVGQNAQMFGWFVNGDKNTDHGSDAPVVTIRDNSSSLHAWVRRAASKLTIAFDTKSLNENVYIYLKSITVKDIPKHCYLDKDNAVGADNYTLESKLVDGETILFKGAQSGHNGKTNHSSWPVIAAGDTIFGLYSDTHGKPARGTDYATRLAREHSESARALYFYENMQPDGIEGTVTDKRQDVSGNNITVTYPYGTYDDNHTGGNLNEDAYEKGWKDGKQWGSYIEIEAYYENNGGEHPGKGDIIYRFMLGKDTKINYEAERNHHYRLTMRFNGNANDIDFHIDYKEEAKPGLFTQDTTYVSYLYNQPATTTVRATPQPGYDFVSFEAVILENQWVPYPADECRHLYNATAWDMQRDGKDSYATKWTTDPSKEGGWDGNLFYKRDDDMANNTEFGFLSLREVKTVTKEFGGNTAGVTLSELVRRFRRAYFCPHLEPDQTDVNGPLNWREYTDLPTADGTVTHTDEVDGTYTFTRTTNPNNLDEVDYVGVIPLFTRAKTLDSWAVYSGANAFYEHQRYAKIKFTAHYKYNPSSGKPKVKGDSYSESSLTNVMQARRIDNPRGIYRRYNNSDAFHVRLCYELLTPDADGDNFEELISRGPWTATIEKDPAGLVSISANGQTASGEGQSITGRTLTPVQFIYRPNGKLTDNTKSRGAIIAVTYHNNSCTHKILVRQGYAPHVIGTHGTVKWSTFNVYNKEHLTRSPLSVGSLFRRHSTLDYPIMEVNNERFGVGIHPLQTDTFRIFGQKGTKWEDIPCSTNPATAAFTGMQLYNHIQEGKINYRLPTFDDLTEIGIVTKDDPKSSGALTQIPNEYINDYNYAFGITYADGAITTLLTSDAYSYTDYDNKGEDSRKGVRGVIVYAKSNGDNVHFPLGATGHARRKSRGLDSGHSHKKSYGYMRYGTVDFRLDRDSGSDHYRPMAWDLPSQKGGGYWVNSGNEKGKGIAIDYNSGNYMASYLNQGDLYLYDSKPDALPIKPVHK
ncbi:MAG: hypothetical protein NC418_10185 [Muribaculaceae bacterium]|nr:hypothetical protein [Muribaculaceae bacterium]